MIKIATIEDEENIRQEIVRYIKKGIGSIEGVEVDVYESAERYLLVGGRYDLVISDIELPGISGLELGKRIKENNPDVYLVFLTSHSEFASESYIIEAYQYILKKDIEERLSPLIERVVHEIKKDYEEYRWVGTNQRKIKIYHKDIVCIQKIKGSKYAEYITENGKYMERLSMNQILEQIHSNAFILVDRGHAVNVNMTELPMIRVTTYYGAQHIGVSASEYEKLTGKDVNLSEREILVGIEDSEYQKEKKITDEDYLNTYSFLFTGKYQEDMAEISHTDPQYLYDIKDIFTQNVIGQYSTDQWHENIIVFSDTYFQKQWEAMRGDDQEATVLRLFTFSGKRKENAWKELSEYQKECGVKNDSDTRMESYLYGTEEYLIGQKMRVLFSLSSKLFLMMALFISAFFVNGIKILSELSGYERRYEFLRCMGMKQKQRRKTIRFETQMLSDIALFATVMMGIVYVLSYEWRCASKDAGSLDVTFWMYWILIVGIYLLADRLVQWLFAQYVIKRVEKGND